MTAPYLENGRFLFPGTPTEMDGKKRMIPRHDVRWLVDQILHFGAATDDDGVDSVTQLIDHTAGWLGDAPPKRQEEEPFMLPWERAVRERLKSMKAPEVPPAHREAAEETNWCAVALRE